MDAVLYIRRAHFVDKESGDCIRYLIGPGQCQMRVSPSELENVNGYKEKNIVSDLQKTIDSQSFPLTSVSSTNKTDHYDIIITEILLKVTLNTITLAIVSGSVH